MLEYDKVSYRATHPDVEEAVRPPLRSIFSALPCPSQTALSIEFRFL